MVSIYEMKKSKIDFIIAIYLIFITLFNVFIAINKTFAFAIGITINTNETTNAIGVTLADLVANTSSSERVLYELLIVILFVLIFVLLILNVFDYAYVKKNNHQAIKKIQIVSALVYFGLIASFSTLFSNGTKSADHQTIRIYGTGLFGIVGLISFIVLGVLEFYLIGKTLNSERIEKNQGQIPVANQKTTYQRQTGMILIIIYQILIGILIIISGFFVYALANTCISFGALGGCQGFTPDKGLEIVVVLIMMWGLVGIISASLLITWNYYGYVASWFFLITTGIILFEIYLVPLVCMIISLYYYTHNMEFKESIKMIKAQRRDQKNV